MREVATVAGARERGGVGLQAGVQRARFVKLVIVRRVEWVRGLRLVRGVGVVVLVGFGVESVLALVRGVDVGMEVGARGRERGRFIVAVREVGDRVLRRDC